MFGFGLRALAFFLSFFALVDGLCFSLPESLVSLLTGRELPVSALFLASSTKPCQMQA